MSIRCLLVLGLTLLEDREMKQIILSYPRSYDAYKSNEWATARLALK